MPGFHSCAGAMTELSLLTMQVLSTIARGWVEFYRRAGTIGTFDFPLEDMTRFGEAVEMDYAAMEDYVSAGGNTNWWLARFYGNYDNQLDGYIRWGTMPGMVYHYEFRGPEYLYAGVPMNEHGIYVDPRNWFRSTSYRLIRVYTDAEFAAVNTIAVPATIADGNDDDEPITVEDLPIPESVEFVATIGASSMAVDDPPTGATASNESMAVDETVAVAMVAPSTAGYPGVADSRP